MRLNEVKGGDDVMALELLLAAILEKGREGAYSGTCNTTQMFLV